MENNINIKHRREAMAQAKQIIVKAGTRLLIDRQSIARLVDGIAMLRKQGYRVESLAKIRALSTAEGITFCED